MFSIIIPAYNNFPYTYRCVISILNSDFFRSNELIIIDNNSTDKTKIFLSKLNHKNIKILTNNENIGFSKACNQGAHFSNGENLIFLNNDTEVTFNWLCSFQKYINTNSNFGIVGCKLLYPDHTIQHAGIAFSSSKVHHIYRNFHYCHPVVNKQRDFQAVTAACMLVPRQLFLSISGFDESFINGFEDLDFCFRARSKGYKVTYTPDPIVIHHESKTPGRHDHHAHNASLFATRWLSSVAFDLDTIYAQDGLSRHSEYEDKFGGKWLTDVNSNCFWDSARSLAMKGSFQEAENYYYQALSFNPYDIRRLAIAEELADLYTRWERFSDAESCLDSIIQVNPSQRMLEKKARIATLAHTKRSQRNR